MSQAHLNLNRPVFLARRDVCFEVAVEMLYMPMQEMNLDQRLTHVGAVLGRLLQSLEYARAGVRAGSALPEEQQFVHFLEIIVSHVESAEAMIEQQALLEREEGFLRQFLEAAEEDTALPALAYRRRAEDIFQGLWHLLRMAHAPYRRLQQALRETFTPEVATRYQRAQDRLRQELAASVSCPFVAEN
ncbi:MAG: hypothetical protein K9N49_07100 [Candidatus Marinimicrobia bacterium]|nr:hypothetical protein [Candidatus Neomarinimicrobiota bacterium]